MTNGIPTLLNHRYAKLGNIKTYYRVKRLLNTQRGAKLPSLLRHPEEAKLPLMCV